MKTKQEVKEKATSIIQDFLFIEEEINEEKNLKEDIGLDSLDAVELTMFIEEEFDIEIEDDEILKGKTFGDVVDLICKKLNINS
jgi:acyl carrier protein